MGACADQWGGGGWLEKGPGGLIQCSPFPSLPSSLTPSTGLRSKEVIVRMKSGKNNLKETKFYIALLSNWI